MHALFGPWVAGATIVACLATPLAAAESANRFQRARDDYARLDQAEQESWLADLFHQRSLPACRVFMDAQPLQQLMARHRAVLARIHAGKQLRSAGLEKLLAEVDEQEQAAIEKLSRDFEFGAAQAFHANRAQFEKWMAAWRKAHDRWDQAGRPWEQQPQLIHWLQSATARQRQIAKTVLPPATVQATTKPRQPASSKTASTAGPKIDLAELGPRIAGYNLALAELVARLHGRQPWDARQLDAALDTLTELAALRWDLQLYWNLLPAEKRARVQPLQPLGPAIALVGSQTSAARQQLEHVARDDVSTGEPTDEAAERRRLDRVSQRLAELATSHP